ncbi:hypothetical protein [Moorena sp. SIOASIH]|uniref:hypothetical protein n=1 Tax=Moorena sp. SIOASIH TaxID=2607817 RepID=UPI0025F4F59F|nr:hypothetical protein [Moorena sp. SIOASIH]
MNAIGRRPRYGIDRRSRYANAFRYYSVSRIYEVRFSTSKSPLIRGTNGGSLCTSWHRELLYIATAVCITIRYTGLFSRFPIPDSRFPITYSLFPIAYSLLPIPYSLLKESA